MLEGDKFPQIILNYGMSRKKALLKDIGGIYDGIKIPGNILLYQYRGTPAFIFTNQKPYFVDPMSYLFGQPFSSFKRQTKAGLNFKPSFRKLLEGHGFNSKEYIDSNSVVLLDSIFKSEKTLAEFVTCATEFQLNAVSGGLDDIKALMTLEEFENLSTGMMRPQICLPPYFLYSQNFSAVRNITTAIELNSRILSATLEIVDPSVDLFPVILINRDELITSYADEVADALLGLGFPGHCVWIDGFDERYASREEVLALANFIRKLAGENESKKQVVLLYGGFFSLLLHHFGLSAICHGLSYGESRKIGASANKFSGPAPRRYYIRDLHRFFTLDDSLKILRKRPDLICSCPVCQRVIAADPERVAKFEGEEALSELHFLYNRDLERNTISKSSDIAEIAELLKWSSDLNDDISSITKVFKRNSREFTHSVVDTEYLNIWAEGLEAAGS